MGNNSGESMATFQVNPFLKDLLKSRHDDFRISLLDDVLFSEEFRANMQTETTGKLFRVAETGDGVQYAMIADIEMMRQSIEGNITNLAKLKAMKGQQPIVGIWVVLFEVDPTKPDEGVFTSVYLNPSASDCRDIITGKTEVMACFFVIEFGYMPGQKPAEATSDVASINWVMLSPGDGTKIDEYTETYRKQYARTLEMVFSIDFSDKS